MVGYIEGVVRGAVRETIIVVPTGGGVGYRLFVPASTLLANPEGAAISLWTHLAIKENAHDLYGFETKEELQWFEMLITVSGIGPRLALSILNRAPGSALAHAISRGAADTLVKGYGVGKKTAEKIVLELREKVAPGEAAGGEDGMVIDALMSLGYSMKEAREAVAALPPELDTTEERVRGAIRLASKR